MFPVGGEPLCRVELCPAWPLTPGGVPGPLGPFEDEPRIRRGGLRFIVWYGMVWDGMVWYGMLSLLL